MSIFFSVLDCNIVGKVNGVCFTYSKEGRPSGEAFIELKTADDFKNALSKDRKYMGHRYIEGKQHDQSRLVFFADFSLSNYYHTTDALKMHSFACKTFLLIFV